MITLKEQDGPQRDPKHRGDQCAQENTTGRAELIVIAFCFLFVGWPILRGGHLWLPGWKLRPQKRKQMRADVVRAAWAPTVDVV